MTHAEIVADIERRGGWLVASFELDARGETVGAPGQGRKLYSCAACGEVGHTIRRCSGAGKKPRPTYDELRASKRILADRIAARSAERKR